VFAADNKSRPAHVRRAAKVFGFNLRLNRIDDHVFEQYLERHGVSAAPVSDKEFAIAIKNTVGIANVVFTVVAVKI
jgi:hypothetical protein